MDSIRKAERWRTDPEFRARHAVRDAARRERVRADMELTAARAEVMRSWRERNAARVAEYERRYRKAKAEQVTEKNRRRRAMLLGAWVEDVDIDVLWRRDRGLCGLCGEAIDRSLEWPHKMSLTVDHIVPLAHGGLHAVSNTQIAHAVCNSRKNDRPA